MRGSLIAITLAMLLIVGADARYSPGLEIADGENITLDGGNISGIANSPQSADVVIYEDDNYIYAVNETWYTIGSCDADIDASGVLQDAVDYLSGSGNVTASARGTIQFRYVNHAFVNQTVYSSLGTYFDFGTSTIDISACDATAFQFGSPAFVYAWGELWDGYNRITGMRNGIFVGAHANTNSTIAAFYNIPRGISIHDLSISEIYNGILISGCSYSAVVDHVAGHNVIGAFITLADPVDSPCEGGPINTAVNFCEVSNDASHYAGTGIDVNAQRCRFVGNYLEGFDYCMIVNDSECEVFDGYMYPDDHGVVLRPTADQTTIRDVKFDLADLSGNAIYFETSAADNLIDVSVDGNTFESASGKSIIGDYGAGEIWTASFIGNKAQIVAASNFALFTVPVYYSIFTGNIVGDITMPYDCDFIESWAAGASNIINDNNLRRLKDWAATPSWTNSNAEGNVFTSVTNSTGYTGTGWEKENLVI